MTLQLYLLRRHLVSIGFALAGLGILVIPAITVPAVSKLGSAGISAVLEYVPLVLIELVPYIVPIAFLLGVVAAFGRLAADNEWTAIRMAGVHPLKVLLPGALVAVAGSALTYAVLSQISPEWRYQQRAFLRASSLEKLKGLGNGRTQFSIGDIFLDAHGIGDEGVYYDVLLGIPARLLGDDPGGKDASDDEQDDVIVIIADEIQVSFQGVETMRLDLLNASVLRDDWELRSEYPRYVWALDSLVSSKPKRRDRPHYFSTADLRERLKAGVPYDDEDELTDKQRDQMRYEIQFRKALSVSYGIFLLLGAATGLWLKSGTQLGAMTGAIGIAFVYFVMQIELGQQLSKAGILAPGLAAWATDALFLIFALVAARRVLWR